MCYFINSAFYILTLLDCLFYISDTMYSVAGAVYLFYHVLIDKSIIWSDFNLQDDDWELLQIGLVLLFLQVSGRKTAKQTDKKMGGRYSLTIHMSHGSIPLLPFRSFHLKSCSLSLAAKWSN